MADIVNLRQARKAKARTEKDELAAANRAKFGRSKAEKQLTAAKSELESRRLEGHRLGGVDVTPVAKLAKLAATPGQDDPATSDQSTAAEAIAPNPPSYG